MGTRADFYVGKNETAEWIGSIAWDGYRADYAHPDVGVHPSILGAKSEEEFREAIKTHLENRDDWTAPERGWPWPWDTSEISDCSYWFFDGQVWDVHNYPSYPGVDSYIPATLEMNEEGEPPEGTYERVVFPDMKERKNVTLGSRSGLMIIGTKT